MKHKRYENNSIPLILLLLTDTIRTRTSTDHMETQKAKTNLLLLFKNLPSRMMSSSNTRILEIISQEINNNQYLIVKLSAITNSSH